MQKQLIQFAIYFPNLFYSVLIPHTTSIQKIIPLSYNLKKICESISDKLHISVIYLKIETKQQQQKTVHIPVQ